MLAGPLVALLGLLAVVFVLRTRWRVRRSLYESLRAERQRQIEAAHRRGGGTGGEASAGRGPAEPPVEAGVMAQRVRESRLQSAAGTAALVATVLLVVVGILLVVGQPR